VVELVALEGARITYTTIQNWFQQRLQPGGPSGPGRRPRPTWSGSTANIGSRLTHEVPLRYLDGAQGHPASCSRVAYAGAGQHQDAGAKMIHADRRRTSTIISKSTLQRLRITTYRGTGPRGRGGQQSKSFVRCDALLLDETAVSETKPYMGGGRAGCPYRTRGHGVQGRRRPALLSDEPGIVREPRPWA